MVDRRAYEKACKSSVKPSTWWREWYSAYRAAKAKGITDISSILAAKDFLCAIRAEMAPDWATGYVCKLIRGEVGLRNSKINSLEEYPKELKALIGYDED